MTFRHLLLVAPLALFAACEFPDTTTGKLGNFNFSFADCDCNVADNAMLAGGRASIQVSPAKGQPRYARVASSDPSIAQFTMNASEYGRVDTEAVAAGAADLLLYDEADKLIDRVTLRVEAPSELTFSPEGPLLRVIEGGEYVVNVVPVGTRGRLIGDGATRIAISGVLVDRSPVPPTYGSGAAVRFTGSAGRGQVTATAGGLTRALDVELVAERALTSLTLESRGQSLDLAFAAYHIADAVGPVHGAPCRFTFSSPNVTVYDQSFSLTDPVETTVQLEVAAVGRYTATCTVGSLSASIEVVRTDAR
jgi:hypothetical protein